MIDRFTKLGGQRRDAPASASTLSAAAVVLRVAPLLPVPGDFAVAKCRRQVEVVVVLFCRVHAAAPDAAIVWRRRRALRAATRVTITRAASVTVPRSANRRRSAAFLELSVGRRTKVF